MTVRRGSSASNDLDVESCWNVDPLSAQGRSYQTIGLTLFPIMPGIGLALYSCYLISGLVEDLQVASSLRSAVLTGEGMIPLLVALENEREGYTVFTVTNGSEVLGTLNEFQQQTDLAISNLVHWPTGIFEEINTRDEFRIFLANYRAEQGRSLFHSESTVLQLQKYSQLTDAIKNWIVEPLVQSRDNVVWDKVVSFTDLLHCCLAMGLERALGTTYYLTGQLWAFEHELFLQSLATGKINLHLGLELNEEARETYTKRFLSNGAFVDSIDKYRTTISRNARVSDRLYDGVIWNRKYSYYISMVWDIRESMRGSIIDELDTQLQLIAQGLAYNAVLAVVVFCMLLPFLIFTATRTTHSLYLYALTTEKKNFELRREKRKSEAILNQMLPRQVAHKLRRGESVGPEEFDLATVFFSDVEDFADISAKSNPMQIVAFLNDLYYFMDSQIERYDVYKVETISCVYMVCSGIPMRNGIRHASEIARMALDMLYLTEDFRIQHLPNRMLNLRIGAHTGPAVAGVVGNKMPRYCLFGDTVNTAARMQTNGQPRRIHISGGMRNVLMEMGGYVTERRGYVTLKGKGEVETWWLTEREEIATPMTGTENTQLSKEYTQEDGLGSDASMAA